MPLPFPKIDRDPLPIGADPDEYITAADWNALCSAIEAGVPVSRVTASAIPQYALVKPSTTAGRVALWLHTDSLLLITGVALATASGAGQTIDVLEQQGVESFMLSDGTTTIAAGDLVQPSATVDGRIMKGSVNPIGVAMSAGAAVLDTHVSVL